MLWHHTIAIQLQRNQRLQRSNLLHRSPTSSKDDDRELEGSAVEVFVGGLPPDTKEEEVQQAFSAVGQVTGLRLNRRKRTGECKGFGFVRYTDQATAEKACSEVREASSSSTVVVLPLASLVLY